MIAYAPLLEPLRLGPKTMPNRLVFAAHTTNFAEHNVLSERHAAYYARRARGGVGLIVLEEQIVHPSDYPYERACFGYDERSIAAYQRVAERIRAVHRPFMAGSATEGGPGDARPDTSGRARFAPRPAPTSPPSPSPRAWRGGKNAAGGVTSPPFPSREGEPGGLGPLILAQLNHNGGQASGDYSQAPVWAPSPVPDVASREVPKAMEIADIAEVVAGFARAATFARQGRLDGVEIEASDRSLIRQFLSPLTNQRDDGYGGSLENRLRFCLEVIEAVAAALGDGLVLGLRLCGDEYAPWAGLTPEQSRAIAQRLAATGRLRYLAVSAGGIYTTHLFPFHASMHVPDAYTAHLAAGIKAGVDIPVIASGRLEDPRVALNVLRESQADAADVTRALIADPDLPAKLHAGAALPSPLTEGGFSGARAPGGAGETPAPPGAPPPHVEGQGRVFIRPCIVCNQDCQVRHALSPLLSCTVNPAAGHEAEAEWAEPTPPTPLPLEGRGGKTPPAAAPVPPLHRVERGLGGEVGAGWEISARPAPKVSARGGGRFA
jgi:2,4-dienoyl-CoA reductase-like NADH-dependent reductase (Old Yellow Enzyme family)